MLRVCVLGAGVVGLCSALSIQQNVANVSVTVIADKFTTDTLSDGAAGIFRPSNSVRGPSEDSVRQWARDSFELYKSLASGPESEKIGIKEISGFLLARKYEEITQSTLLEELLPVWRKATQEEVKRFPGDWKFGTYFTTLLIECRRFLPWLMDRIKSNGGTFVEKRIDSFEEVADSFDVIVNCTGFEAKYLCNDKKVVPLRGQVIKVTAPWVKDFCYGDYDTYIVPGFDFVTLGGTRQYDSYNDEVDRHDAAAIWERCSSLLPSLKDAVVQRHWVGFRPHRDPVRLVTEMLKSAGGKQIPVVHNYGHGGYGITLAWGCAVQVVALVNEVRALCRSKL